MEWEEYVHQCISSVDLQAIPFFGLLLTLTYIGVSCHQFLSPWASSVVTVLFGLCHSAFLGLQVSYHLLKSFQCSHCICDYSHSSGIFGGISVSVPSHSILG
jgi:hypothetical protein